MQSFLVNWLWVFGEGRVNATASKLLTVRCYPEILALYHASLASVSQSARPLYLLSLHFHQLGAGSKGSGAPPGPLGPVHPSFHSPPFCPYCLLLTPAWNPGSIVSSSPSPTSWLPDSPPLTMPLPHLDS